MASSSPAKTQTSSENGENSPSEVTVSRKDRRKEWWQQKKKQTQEQRKSDLWKEDSESDSPRTKLRNRESIAKPDSLKYEPDPNKGFHSRLMQSLYVNTASKKKKNVGEGQTSPDLATNKRRSSGSQPDSPSKTKKLKPSEQSEVFDSYKFSLELINGNIEVPKETSSKDSKNKYVLFIGNLPYDVTREQLEEHFRKTGGIRSIRIPRDKSTDKGRGFAYMEFDSRISHGIALRLHQTTLGGRKINVEFTSIGGGKSDLRKEKLKQKNLKRSNLKLS